MTFEFKAAVLPNGQIALPTEIAGQIPAGKELQVVLAWETPVDADFQALGKKLHEAAYASEDSVYDSLA
jgi:hypothetical protein